MCVQLSQLPGALALQILPVSTMCSVFMRKEGNCKKKLLTLKGRCMCNIGKKTPSFSFFLIFYQNFNGINH